MAIESVGEPPQLRRLFQDLQKMSSAIEVAMGAAVGDITVAGPPILFAEYALPLRSGPILSSSAASSQMHDGAVGVATARGLRPTSRRAGAGAGATAATGQAPVRVWTPMSHPRGEHEHDRERVHVLETAVVGWVSFTVWPAPHVLTVTNKLCMTHFLCTHRLICVCVCVCVCMYVCVCVCVCVCAIAGEGRSRPA